MNAKREPKNASRIDRQPLSYLATAAVETNCLDPSFQPSSSVLCASRQRSN